MLLGLSRMEAIPASIAPEIVSMAVLSMISITATEMVSAARATFKAFREGGSLVKDSLYLA
jgi:hypothetical protein